MRTKYSSKNTWHLRRLEDRDSGKAVSDYLLWPTTKVNDAIQRQIRGFVGASDYETWNRESRPNVLAGVIKELVEEGKIPEDFHLLDVLCGDAFILSRLSVGNWTKARFYGIDCNIGSYSHHHGFRSARRSLHRIFLQSLVKEDLPEKMDVILMLNTFRNWTSARLRPQEQDLPEQVESWLMKNCRYLLVTLNSQQLAEWWSKYVLKVITSNLEEYCSLVLVSTEGGIVESICT